MNLKRIEQTYSDYKKAVERLKEALEEDIAVNKVAVDAVIQRFEFTFELSWKLAKIILAYNGVEVTLPRLIIKEAFKMKMINNGQAWIDMLEDRNKTSHIYDEDEALEIYEKIRTGHFKMLKSFEKSVKNFMK
ncbi:MAG: HI0074 family nucleotidyltransferase substrate-binding subunit [Candidatus Omnitrophota bacterium]